MIEYKVCDNRTEWRLDGVLHRTDGPAVEYASGIQLWYQMGLFHRTDGPAIEWPCGHKNWYLDNEELTEEDHALKIRKLIS